MDVSKLIKDIYRKFKINNIDKITELEQSLLKTYLLYNNVDNNTYILDDYDDYNKEIVKYVLDKMDTPFTISLLSEMFELLIPHTEKKRKGAVYTEDFIIRYIVDKVVINKQMPYICDPSCGCGSFLIYVAQFCHKKYSLSYEKIFSDYIYGVDIDENAIRRSKILFSLLFIENNEPVPTSFNLIHGNMLNTEVFNKLTRNGTLKFNCVIGNPPYVRAKNMEDDSKQYLSSWKSSANGNVDLYMPFYEIGLQLLSDDGILGYISPNTYIQAVNGRCLREYLKQCSYQISIIDFRDNQMFNKVTSYTCITIISKAISSNSILYTRAESTTLELASFSSYNILSFKDNSAWRLCDTETDKIIYKLEHSEIPLSKWSIRNGLATLKNDLYFFEPDSEDEKYLYRTYNDKKYAIEKAICIDIVKPNIIKNEQQLAQNNEKAIFPYTKNTKNDKFIAINEDIMKNEYPNTYQMFIDNKDILNNRDKGYGKYETWYAYGRTQGMNNFGKKLMIPYISGEPVAVLSTNENLLFYCGYALFSEEIEELHILKKFLESDAFWYYICKTSKPYSKGFMALAKNYIIRFSIPQLSIQEQAYLLSEKDHSVLNQWIWSKYGIIDIPRD